MKDLARCQIEPYLKTLTTTVISCTQTIKAQQENKKKSKTDNITSANTTTYDVVLEDTVLYPEGGGQSSDTGLINNEIVVSFVHKSNDGQIIHQTNAPVTPGQTVTVTVDWNRRYDHMQQHSSQHLISAIFTNIYGYNTISWWLSTSPTECYIDFDQPTINSEQLDAVERRCNEVIRAASSLHMHTYPSVENALLDQQFVSRLQHKTLGDNIVGTVRVIEMEGVEWNLCGGTHVANTSELQLICLSKTESIKGTSTRVFFYAGERALISLRDSLRFTRSMTSLLSATGDKAIENLKRVQLEQRTLVKVVTKQTREIADLVAQTLYAEWQRKVNEESDKTILIHHHHEETNMLFLASVADNFNNLVQQHANAPPQKPLIFLTCSDALESKEGQFLLMGGPVDCLPALGNDIAVALQGRGGGKGKIQGKASRIDHRTNVIELIQQRFNII